MALIVMPYIAGATEPNDVVVLPVNATTKTVTLTSQTVTAATPTNIWLIRKLWFYPNNVATRNRKNFLSVTPLTSARKPFSLALNDSAAALVLRLIK